MFTPKTRLDIILPPLMIIIFGLIVVMEALPSYDKRYERAYDMVHVCLTNCAQCKQMYGDYFKGQTCGESCVSLNGRFIPDCLDGKSIAPFINVIH